MTVMDATWITQPLDCSGKGLAGYFAPRSGDELPLIRLGEPGCYLWAPLRPCSPGVSAPLAIVFWVEVPTLISHLPQSAQELNCEPVEVGRSGPRRWRIRYPRSISLDSARRTAL